MLYPSGRAAPTTALATAPAADDQQMESWWDDLQKPEPWSCRALLDFSSKPDQAVAFFKTHLPPLKIEQKDLDDALANEDEKIWKPAFEKLQYLDPRLNQTLDTLMQNVTDPLARTRLVEILSGYEPDHLKGHSIALRAVNNGLYIFTSDNRNSWIVESKVSKLDTEGGRLPKKQWARADRAIVLLQHIGTPEALAILKNLATGNPDAQPTKIAKVAVDSLTVSDKSAQR